MEVATNWAVLEPWLRAQGVRWDEQALRIGPPSAEEGGDGSGVGVYAASALTNGMDIGSIPKSAVLSIANSPWQSVIRTSFAARGHDEDTLLTVVVLAELKRGTASPWYGYLASMPQSRALVPADWSAKEVARLHGTEFDAEMVIEEKRQLKHVFHSVRPLLRRLGLLNRVVEEEALFADFKLCHGWVSSRAFYVDERHGEALAPFADLFNHKHSIVHTAAGKRAIAADETLAMEMALVNAGAHADTLYVKVFSDVPAGREVRNTYGEIANCVLLKNYGFCISGNPHDVVYIRRQELVWAAQRLTAAFFKGAKKRPAAAITSNELAAVGACAERGASFDARLRFADIMQAALATSALEEDDEAAKEEHEDGDATEFEDEDSASEDEELAVTDWLGITMHEPVPFTVTSLLYLLLEAPAHELAALKTLAKTPSDGKSSPFCQRMRALLAAPSDLFRRCPAAAAVLREVLQKRLARYEEPPVEGKPLQATDPAAETSNCAVAARTLRACEQALLRAALSVVDGPAAAKIHEGDLGSE